MRTLTSLHHAFIALLVCAAACGKDVTPRADSVAVRVDSATPAPVAAAPAPETATPPAVPSASSGAMVVSEHGIGAVKIGMTLAEASSAAKGSLTAPPAADTAECGFATWKGGPAGLRFMTAKGHIARVDVSSGSVATAEGARVGDAEEKITALYPGRVQVGPSKYSSGHTLTVKGASPADSIYRFIFDTDGKRVKSFRAGRLPEVAFVEGCG